MTSRGKNICVVAYSLGGGGAEKASALQTTMFHNLGYNVFVVSVVDDIQYVYKGKLLNLGTFKKQNDTIFGRFKRLLVFRKFIKENKIDIVVDNRTRTQAYREFIVSKFIYKIPTIYVAHSYNVKEVFPQYIWLNRFLYKNAPIVSVSKALEKQIKDKFGSKRTQTIYNGFGFSKINKMSNALIRLNDSPLEKFIIFFGRLSNGSKNIKLLLDAYKLSNLGNEGINLLLLGSGPDEEILKNHVNTLGLSKYVIFKGFEKNPYPYVKQSLFMVLSSRYEGFPMVIPEALSLGIPVVSVDCQSGPNEVIINGHNGLLVENHNPEKLAKAMRTMATDKALYETCKSNARESVERFSITEISKLWEKLFEQIIKN